jgi:two-component system LytT family response regulator
LKEQIKKDLIIVNIEDIVRCESDRNYTCFYLNNNEKIIVSKTLKIFEKQLEKYFFIRAHKSHLININYIKKYIKSNGGYVMLLDGSKIPVSVRKKHQLLKLLKSL